MLELELDAPPEAELGGVAGVALEELEELSRFDARAEQAELRPVDLVATVRSIVASRLPEASVQAPGGQVVVDGDVRRLDRIIGNLLDNARAHAPGAAVEVTVARDAGGATVRVADRGPGAPRDALAHLFDRFYKADASRAGGSSGLGLAIAAEHATLLGGTLEAANQAEGGLAVTLRLPVTEPLPVGDGLDTGERDAVHGSNAASAPTEPARPIT